MSSETCCAHDVRFREIRAATFADEVNLGSTKGSKMPLSVVMCKVILPVIPGSDLPLV